MPIIVPIEENQVGLASATNTKFRAPDYSGSGLQALGSGLTDVGKGGAQLAQALDEQRTHRDDAAIKQAYVGFGNQADPLLHSYFSLNGSAARAALPQVEADLQAAGQAQIDGVGNDRRRAMIAQQITHRVAESVAAARSHAGLQDIADQAQQNQSLQDRSVTDALNNIDNPALYEHHIETGKNGVRQHSRLAGQPPAQGEAAAHGYQSGIHLTHIDTRAADDAVGALVAVRRHGSDMRPDDMRKALTGIAPRFSYERAIADVDAADLAASPFAPQAPRMSADDLRDRMLVISPDAQQGNLPSLLQRYQGDAARSWAAAAMGPDKLDALIAQRGDGWYQALPQPVLLDVAQHMALLGARSSTRAMPSDPAAAATRIVNQPDIDDERRQHALDELNWRVRQADETRRSAESEAAGRAQALTTELGTGFTSIAQIPPAIRRTLPAAVIDELSHQARANIYPDQTTTSDLPLVTGVAPDAGPAGDTPGFDPDAQASRQPADQQFNPLAPLDGESPPASAGSFDAGIANTDIAPTDTEAAGDGPDPYAGLRELFGRLPGGLELQNANATGKLDKPSAEVVRQRAALAARWRRLTPQQRLHDPELSTPARAIEAARVLLLRRDPRLKRNLGVAALPGGKYVADMIVDELAYKVIHDSIAAGHKFPPVTDADLRPGGRHSMYLYDEIKIAAAAALNYRQQQAWDFFTSGDHPYTREQAAGLIAALTMENNLDPEKLQEGGGGGYGIAQWNEIRSNIFRNLYKTPLKGTTFDQQLRYVKYELDHGVYKSVGDQLRNTSTAYDAGFLITRDYEVPRDRVKTPVDRARYALEVFREFQNRPRR